MFHHWARADEEVDGNVKCEFLINYKDYKFARFNKKISLFNYTNEQYNKYFKGNKNIVFFYLVVQMNSGVEKTLIYYGICVNNLI